MKQRNNYTRLESELAIVRAWMKASWKDLGV